MVKRKSQVLHSKAPKPALGLTQPLFNGYRGSFTDGTATGHEDNSHPPGATAKKHYAVMTLRGIYPLCVTQFEDHSHEAGNNRYIQFSAFLGLQISALSRERDKNIMEYNTSEKRNKTADMKRLNSVAGTGDTCAVNQQT